MLTQTLIDDVKDYFRNLISEGEVGTGTTDPTVGDTALESAISGTKKALDRVDQSGNVITAVYILGSSEANGNDISEFGLWNSDLLARIVFTPVSKTSDIILEVQHATEFAQENL